jgi:hypothetical protein
MMWLLLMGENLNIPACASAEDGLLSRRKEANNKYADVPNLNRLNNSMGLAVKL